MKNLFYSVGLMLVCLLMGCNTVPAYAQSYALMPVPHYQFFDRNGTPLSGGKVCTYLAGSSTPTPTYSNSTGTANTNPVTLDSGGYATIYLGARSYKIVLQDSSGTAGQCTGGGAGVTIWTQDNVYDYAQLLQLSLATSITTGSIITGTIDITGVGSTCGNSAVSSNGVVLLCDNTWTNPNVTTSSQESRTIQATNRKIQTVADTGADQFGIDGAVTIEAGTTANVSGQMKGVAAEIYLKQPNTGTYTVTTALGVESSLPVLGTHAIIQNYANYYASAPCRPDGGGCYNGDGSNGGGIITGYGFGLVLEGMPNSVAATLNRGAIWSNALEVDGQHKWSATGLRESLDSNGASSVVVTGGSLQVGRQSIAVSGTVTTIGKVVTKVSGNSFTTGSSWNDATITINAVQYTVQSVISGTVLNLTSSAGTQASPVAYSVTQAADSGQLRLAYQNAPPSITGYNMSAIYSLASNGHTYVANGSGTVIDLNGSASGGCSPFSCWSVGTGVSTGTNTIGSGIGYFGSADAHVVALVANAAEVARLSTLGGFLVGATTNHLDVPGRVIASDSHWTTTGGSNDTSLGMGLSVNNTYFNSTRGGTGVSLPLAIFVGNTPAEASRIYAHNSYTRINLAEDFQAMSAPDVSTAATSTVVTASSTTVTYGSGDHFVTGTAWIGQPFVCTSGTYEIASVTSSTVLVTTTAGVGAETCVVRATGRIYFDGTHMYFSEAGGSATQFGSGGGGGWAIGTAAGTSVNTIGNNAWLGNTSNFGIGISTHALTAAFFDSNQHTILSVGGGTITTFGAGTGLSIYPKASEDGLAINQAGAGSATALFATSGTVGGSLIWDATDFSVTTGGSSATAAKLKFKTNNGTLAGQFDQNGRFTVNTATAYGGQSRATINIAAGDSGQGLTLVQPANSTAANIAFVVGASPVLGMEVYADGANAHVVGWVGSLYLNAPSGGSIIGQVNGVTQTTTASTGVTFANPIFGSGAGAVFDSASHVNLTLKSAGSTIGTFGDVGTSGNVTMHSSSTGAELTVFASYNGTGTNRPFALASYAVGSLPSAGGQPAGAIAFANDGTAGTSPCTGGGSGAIAVNLGASWACK